MRIVIFLIAAFPVRNSSGLKDRHNPAQGNALGLMSQNISSPERAE